MTLPNFFCVGAQKSGTTTLHNILKQHPEIYLPKIKETKFFQNNSLFFKGLDFYEKEFFGKWKGEKAIGEIDPEYMYFEYVPERIYKCIGEDVKFIFILRNPVDRAYSHYWMSYRRGYECESFENAIKLEPERLKIDEFYKSHFSYIDRGFYAEQIERFLKFFPKENMFFIIFETEFITNRKNTIISLLKFLGVDSGINIDLNIKSNQASIYRWKSLRDFIYKPNHIKKIGKFFMPNKKFRRRIIRALDKINQKKIKPPELTKTFKKELLDRFFLDEIKKLSKLIEKDLSVWLEING